RGRPPVAAWPRPPLPWALGGPRLLVALCARTVRESQVGPGTLTSGDRRSSPAVPTGGVGGTSVACAGLTWAGPVSPAFGGLWTTATDRKRHPGGRASSAELSDRHLRGQPGCQRLRPPRCGRPSDALRHEGEQRRAGPR